MAKIFLIIARDSKISYHFIMNPFFFLSFFVLFFNVSAHELSPIEIQQLEKGKLLKKVQWQEGLIWPKVTFYQLINHTPQENFEIYKNFETLKTYIPGMKESKILKKVSDTKTQIYFEMTMPWPVNKSSHVTENQIIPIEGGNYKIEWKLIKADLLKDTKGFLSFTNFQGKTLFTYENLIIPNSPLASMFKNRVAEDMEKSVKAISEHLEKSLKK